MTPENDFSEENEFEKFSFHLIRLVGLDPASSEKLKYLLIRINQFDSRDQCSLFR